MEEQQMDETLELIASAAGELGEINKQISVLETVTDNLKSEKNQLVTELNILNAGYMNESQEVIADIIDKHTGIGSD